MGHTKPIVLVVDDDPILGASVAALIEGGLGCAVVVARDGISGETEWRAAGERIGLVICDLNMPDRDGVEFLDLMAKSGPKVPVVIVSGAISPVIKAAELLAKARGLEVLATLGKPVDLPALLEIARGAIENRPPASG